MLPYPVSQLLRGVSRQVFFQAPCLEVFKVEAEERVQIESPSAVIAINGICD